MRKLTLLALCAFFISHPSFAYDQKMAPDEATSPACETLTKDCLDAGFSRNGEPGKAFWHDCMRPILFGKKVSGLTIDNKVVRDCRQFKIKNLKEQLEQLKQYRNK